MKPSNIFRQYTWLLNKLIAHRRLSLNRINDMWVNEDVADGNPLARSTFNRHRDAILDMFGIIIDCDRANGNEYFISNLDELKEDSITQWLLASLTVKESIADCAAIHDRILLENVMSGTDIFTTITKAMKSNLLLNVGYRRFGFDNYETTLAPYALKLFNKRWYVLAFNGKWLANYALDRITSISLSKQKFNMPSDFDAKTYFEEFFGIFTDDTPVENVVIRAFGKTPYYLCTLPLHHSQKEIASSEEYTDFSFRIRPTYDFVHHLLHFGAAIEVLEPQSLRETMHEETMKMANLYANT